MPATLLLIPGLLNTPAVFDRLRAAWAGPADLRVADIRGPQTVAAMAAAAWATVADLPAAHTLVVAGFSLGGYVAQQMLDAPRRTIDGLGLLCTSARADSPEGQAQRERATAAMQRDFARYVRSLVGFLVSPAFAADEALADEMRRDMLAVGADTAIAQHQAAAGRLDRRAQLPGWRLPTLVLCGQADPVTPPALSDEMAALLPDTRQVMIPEAGHMVPMEHPATLARSLHELVQRSLDARNPAKPDTPPMETR